MRLIYESFDDLEGLKSYMSAAALGMTGSGWVWLVVDMSIKSLAVVATYGPGTMLVRSRQHRHPNGIDETDLMPRAFSVLGEEIIARAKAKSGSRGTAHTIGGVDPPPTSPTSGVAHRVPHANPRPHARTFSTSPPAYQPLNLTHRLSVQSSSSSTVQFSQTPLAWHQPLEPLSKKNSSTSAGDLLTPSSQYAPGGAEAEETEEFDGPEAPPVPQWNPTSSSDLIGGGRGTNSNKQLGTTKRLKQAGDDLSPLLCLSVHEHAWMSAGLGVWGKEEYLRRFWGVVDWRKVSDVYQLWDQRNIVFRTEKE
jgi:Fe-Mn family superoxide dismutase